MSLITMHLCSMCTSMILNYISRLLQFSKNLQGVKNEPACQTYLHLMSAPGRKIVSQTDLSITNEQEDNNLAVPINSRATKNTLPYP